MGYVKAAAAEAGADARGSRRERERERERESRKKKKKKKKNFHSSRETKRLYLEDDLQKMVKITNYTWDT